MEVIKELYTGTPNSDIRKLCTVLWGRTGECKQTQCPHRSWRERTKAMWYYSPTKNKLIYQVIANTYDFWLSGQYGKYNSNIFLFPPLGPFSLKNDALPLNSLFWSPPTAVQDLKHHIHIWRFLIYIFLGSHVPVLTVN